MINKGILSYMDNRPEEKGHNPAIPTLAPKHPLNGRGDTLDKGERSETKMIKGQLPHPPIPKEKQMFSQETQETRPQPRIP